MIEAQRRCGLAPKIIAPRTGWRAQALAPLWGAEHRAYPCGPNLPALRSARRRAGVFNLALGGPWLYRLALRERPEWIFAHDSLHARAIRSIKRQLGSRVRVHVDTMAMVVECGAPSSAGRRAPPAATRSSNLRAPARADSTARD
jgi:hypothetical protein